MPLPLPWRESHELAYLVFYSLMHWARSFGHLSTRLWVTSSADQLDHVAEYIATMWKLVVLAGFAGLGILIIFKLVRWYRFLRKFKLARITPQELRDKLSAGARLLVLDLQAAV